MKVTKFIPNQKFSEINLNDHFFDSLRENYNDFDLWFKRKGDEGRTAFVFYSEQQIIGFLALKIEDENVDYSNDIPTFTNKVKRLKICTFKTISTSKRIGEFFIEVIHRFAVNNNIGLIYVTMFNNNGTTKLIETLSEYGFVKTCKNLNNELVFSKKLLWKKENTPKQNYPFNFHGVNYGSKIYWLPIESPFHHKLISLSAPSKKIDKDEFDDIAPTYTIEKFYITAIPYHKLRYVVPGDIVVIYRMGEKTPKKYNSIVTGFGCFNYCEDLSSLDIDHFLKKMSNRTAFSRDELINIHKSSRNLTLISFLFLDKMIKKDKSFMTLGELWDKEIIIAPNGPRIFERIELEKFYKMIK